MLAAILAPLLLLQAASTATSPPPRKAREPRTAPSPQPRASGTRVAVPPQLVTVDDGDTIQIRWPGGDFEIVRLLGIDTPETRHVEHDIPFEQPFGIEAQGFARGAFAAATRIDLLRAKTLDPYGRTLAYAFVNGVNYSLLVIAARLAEETVTQYGDNGFPKEAAELLAAAKAVGPLPFEAPGAYRARMRAVTKAMKERGEYPTH